MDIQYIHIPNARFSEGAIYPFRILKTISLGPDDDYYVLEDPNSYKILLPKGFYGGYGFETGKTIIYCKDGNPGPISKKIYARLLGIQLGEEEDKFGWMEIIG